MTSINAAGLDFGILNQRVREASGDVEISGCLGQRFIAAGLGDKKIDIFGTPGNALGAYLNGCEITVHANAQDAVGDTMNDGKIVVHGNIGDAAGYAMRGGKIYVRGDAGYRAGIHIKEYRGKRPVIVIGGRCGSFLGEYQAGGLIIVLGLTSGGRDIVSNFPCTGMHGGKVFVRGECGGIHFPHTVTVQQATEDDLGEIEQYISEFCEVFGYDKREIMSLPFSMVAPDTKNPYKQMYVAN